MSIYSRGKELWDLVYHIPEDAEEPYLTSVKRWQKVSKFGMAVLGLSLATMPVDIVNEIVNFTEFDVGDLTVPLYAGSAALNLLAVGGLGLAEKNKS